VDGTYIYLAEDDGQVPNAYKNLISAFMPFYHFDFNGTVKSTTTYDLILQTMKNVWKGGNPNNINNNILFLLFELLMNCILCYIFIS